MFQILKNGGFNKNNDLRKYLKFDYFDNKILLNKINVKLINIPTLC